MDEHDPEEERSRLSRFADRHPRLYAARHVAVATGEVVFVALGLSVVLRSLLPRVDTSWLPDISLDWLPDLSWVPDPLGWLLGLLPEPPDITLPGWVDTVLGTATWWVPILIAAGIAVHEVEKRKSPRAGSGADEGDA